MAKVISSLLGSTGLKGDKGDIGLTGVAGTNGLDGAKGDKGDQGPQGIQGIQGETGLRGIQGETGPQGPIGFTGEKGADGTGVSIKGSFDNTSQLPASGADGDAYLISGNLHVWNGTAWVNVGNIQGPQGLIGLTGATGNTGPQGVKGEKGDQGIQGIQGLKGDTGAKGDTGSFNGDITADQVTETATRKFQTPTQSAYNDATSSIQQQIDSKQSTLVSGTTVKTIEGQNILGSGNIDLVKADVGLSNVDNTSDSNKPISTATQTALDLKANDSDVVKLSGNQTISGQKSFSLTGKIDMQTDNAFPAISVTALGSNGVSAAEFINNSSSSYSTALRLRTSPSGGVGNVTLSVHNQSPTGTGIVSNASNGGVSISSQSGNGDSYISNITDGGTGRNYVGRNNGTETYSVDKTGNVLGNSYIKRSTPATNILLAGGTDITQASLPVSTATQTALNIKENAFSKNTAFNKNFGTTAGTVVEGGTLGSNAYSSTPYLPLSGGTLTGDLKVPRLFNTILTNPLSSRNSFNSFSANDVVLLQGWVSADFGGIGTEDRVVLGSGFSGKAIIGGHSNALTAWADLIINPDPNSGNVGIGTATPTARLDVNGKIKSSSLSGSTTRIVTALPSGELGTTDIPDSRPYKVYTALLTQTGTNAPVATVLENTLGGTVVWARTSLGTYTGTLAGAFTLNKVGILFGSKTSPNHIVAISSDVNTITIFTNNSGGALTEGVLQTTTFEIKVYN